MMFGALNAGGMASMSGATMEEIREWLRQQNAGKVAMHTYSRDSFPLDPDRSPYPSDEWAREGTIASTVRELAEPIWRDYCIRHRMEWPLYSVELLDGTSLDLDAPIGNEVGEPLSDGIRRVYVRFCQVKET